MANYICLLTRGAEDVRRRFTSVHSEAPMIIQHQSENLNTQCFYLAKLWSVVAKIFYDDRSTENAITGSTLGGIGHIEKGAKGTLFLYLRLSLRVGRLDHHCFFLPLAHCSLYLSWCFPPSIPHPCLALISLLISPLDLFSSLLDTSYTSSDPIQCWWRCRKSTPILPPQCQPTCPNGINSATHTQTHMYAKHQVQTAQNCWMSKCKRLW